MCKLFRSLIVALVVLWTGYTLFMVARYGGAVVLDPETTSRIMAVRNDDQLHTAIGLNYHGVAGALLVVTEVVLVLAALVVALVGRGRPGLAARGVLIAWTALWLGNAVWLQSRGWNRPTDVVLMGAAMVLTLLWAALPRPGRAGSPGLDR